MLLKIKQLLYCSQKNPSGSGLADFFVLVDFWRVNIAAVRNLC